MKSISYKQEIGDTNRICTQEGPTGYCSIYKPPSRRFSTSQRTLEVPFTLPDLSTQSIYPPSRPSWLQAFVCSPYSTQ